MEILKKDFEANLPLIRQAIIEADFIAIDAEFSGLSTSDVRFQNMDEVQQRYSKIQHHVQAFEIVQYGVCAFKKTNTGYVAKPFNFYIFGGDTDNVQSNRTFLSSASSLSFLRSNNFDFNKLIDQGVPFYNYTEERSLFTTPSGVDVIGRHATLDEALLSRQQRIFLEHLRKTISLWLQNGTSKPLLVQTNTGQQKKLLYQELQQGRYGGFLKASSRDTRNVEIFKITSEERFEKSVKSPSLNFRYIIEAIQEANCPVVVHNGMYDICHTVDQFWHNLPESVSDFKQLATDMWSKIVDTKYMAEFHPILRNCFNSSVLGSLYNTVEEELRKSGHVIRMGKGFDRYSSEGPTSCHEAGYDAYMTGVIYLGFIYYIKEKEDETLDIPPPPQEQKRQQVEDEEEEEEEEEEEGEEEEEEGEEEEEEGEEEEEIGQKRDVSASVAKDDGTLLTTSNNNSISEMSLQNSAKQELYMNSTVTPFYNKIFLMRCDTPYIDLEGQETQYGNIQRNRFYLQNIPTGLTHSGIERLYPEIQPISITWVNDNSAWITVRHANKVELVKLGILGQERVRDFVRGGTRQVEGEAFRISYQAANMEILTGEQWEALQLSNASQSTSAGTTVTATVTDAQISPIIETNLPSEPYKTVSTMTTVPNGGSSYDDLDIPLPPSFRGSKRSAESTIEGTDTKKNKSEN